MQLVLPGLGDSPRRAASRRGLAAPEMLLETVARPNGISVRATAPCDSSFDLVCDVGEGVRLSATDRGPPSWSMARGLPSSSPSGDVFVRLRRWIHRRLPSGAEAEDAGLYAQLRAIAVHLADACEPRMRRLALRFLPHLRFRVYKAVREDPTGRVAQLAESCPGALIFALGLVERRGTARAGRTLLAGVAAGRPLDAVLDRALEAWCHAAPRWAARESLGRGAFSHFLDGSEQDRRRALLAQRLLIRRAGRMVSTTALWLPPPLAFAPEDIPRRPRDNALWYRLLKSSATTLCPHEQHPHRSAGVCAFVSAHALALPQAMCAELDELPCVHVGTLLEFAVAEGRHPGRRTDPHRFVQDVRRWAATEGDAVLSAPADLPETTPLARWPYPDLVMPALEIRSIQTAGALAEEGHQLGHCVGALTGEAMASRRFFFSARVGGARLTIELRRRRHGIDVGQIAGEHNRAATRAELSALTPWLERSTLKPPPAPEEPGDDIPF